jgi:phosphopantetheinyl transferase
MFRHVLVRASEYPSFALGQAPAGLLSPREADVLAGLAVVPRRRKWLLGRAAGKRLVRAVEGADVLADAEISILNRASGEPYVVCEGRGPWRLPISLSHRSEVGLAAAPDDAHARIGADVETVEARDAALVRQFFTDGEAGLVQGGTAPADAMVALIWSAKEAVLKLLGLGLRLDTRRVVVTGEARARRCPDGWRALDVNLKDALPANAAPRDLVVFWRQEGGHVVTVALAALARTG